MNIFPSTWAFKIKRFPDGTVKKIKAHFCAQGDRQELGVNYIESWAPGVQWSMISIVMVLAATFNLHSVQCDFWLISSTVEFPMMKNICSSTTWFQMRQRCRSSTTLAYTLWDCPNISSNISPNI
jgi:hypothetical protein